MFRCNSKSLILAIVLIGMVFMCVADTQAGWRHGYRWGGYWGYPGYSYSSWYAPYYGSHYGGHYGVGYGGYHGGCHSCGYAYPYHGWGHGCGHRCGWRSCHRSCCVTSCCGDPCCGTTTLSPIVPSTTVDPTPTPAPLQDVDPTPPAADTFQPLDLNPDPQTQSPLPADAGLLTIGVPEEAAVFINGYRTKSTGAQRQYVSHGLKPGFSYKYEVRAEMVRDGRLVEDTQVVYLRAGNTEHVAVSFDASPAASLAASW